MLERMSTATYFPVTFRTEASAAAARPIMGGSDPSQLKPVATADAHQWGIEASAGINLGLFRFHIKGNYGTSRVQVNSVDASDLLPGTPGSAEH
jgi:hypothetical protein